MPPQQDTHRMLLGSTNGSLSAQSISLSPSLTNGSLRSDATYTQVAPARREARPRRTFVTSIRSPTSSAALTPVAQAYSQARAKSLWNGQQLAVGLPSKGVAEDVVQFAAQVFYAYEQGGSATIKVIRMSQDGLTRSCSVRYWTEPLSALPGEKYVAKEGVITFNPGEHSKTFDIKILSNNMFDTTLMFEVNLESQENCSIDPDNSFCRVMIIDEDLFPSSQFEEEIEKNTDAALHKVGFRLLWAFIVFSFNHVATIWWKSILITLAAQLGNGYYLMTIYIKVWLVDVCLSEDPGSADRLYFHTGDTKRDRFMTAVVLGSLWIFPNFLLTGVDYFVMTRLEMGFNIRKHLRVNLFRKYLNYTAKSRAEVPIQDIKTSMMTDIPQLVSDGYVIIFDLLQIFGKIACVAVFMLRKHPQSALPLVFYPCLMFIYLRSRYNQRLRLLSEQGDGESETMGWLLHATSAHRLIVDYKQRGFVVHKFEEVLLNQRSLNNALNRFNFWNDQIIPWVTVLAVGIYMVVYSHHVIIGTCSLGTYLATINVYKDLGDRFGKLYDDLQAMDSSIDPLAGLTRQFNLPTDVEDRMKLADAREQFAMDFVKNGDPLQLQTSCVYDNIPIKFKGIGVNHILDIQKGLTADIPQGTIVAVLGPHDCGKTTLVNLLTDNVSPSQGMVLYPPHLHVLCVSYLPILLTDLGLLGNLAFGAGRQTRSDSGRLRKILERLDLTKPHIMKTFEKEVEKENAAMEKSSAKAKGGMCYYSPIDLRKLYADEGDEEGDEEEEELVGKDDSEEDDEDDDVDEQGNDWSSRLSFSEMRRIHLARALIFNPEVMALNRPLDELEPGMADTMMSLFREFVNKRGVDADFEAWNRRRPRTLLFTAGTRQRHEIADIVWRVRGLRGMSIEQGPGRHLV
eukprot:TRINITY_DN21611_c0_g1_i1.p1 TRINITY_DN21611_c0_g1~~TRINITY_DN21611_c0_g1_i1.p1  ORF type:complete len:907 (+),score=188.99 TRINITY_DN21611_c0_g1_i1:131-2851(+)